jgi:5'-nucleotidase / UDP-sugar diphosphatase
MLPIRLLWLALTTVLVAGVAALPAAAFPPGKGKPSNPTLSVGDAVAYEGDGRLSFPLTLDGPAPRALRVIAVPLPKTARPAKNYRPGAVSTVIPAGATGGTLEVRIYDNNVVGPDVTFNLRIASAPRATIATRTATGTIRDDDPLTVNLLHINDHHSNLQPANGSLNLGTSGGAFTIPFGGFPRVTAKIKELETQLGNVVKVHAGDAITGTLFYTLFKGEADAALMNTACFDVFALGNHEFDDGDANLADFLDLLGADPNCETTTVAANVVPAIGTPLAPANANDYIEPYVIKEFEGQKVAFIGIDIAQKTSVSSQPLETTLFLDEVETAQRYIDELKGLGIDNVVLVTHYGYENDLALAQAVTGVDAIIGGDSHTLLGDFADFGIQSPGSYPTWTTNADGEAVCVAQAWQYSWVVGELGLIFRRGKLADCGGIPHLLLGDQITRGGNPIPDNELSEILGIIEAAPQLGIVTPDPVAQATLDAYSEAVDELSQQPIGAAGEPLCLRRVPNRTRSSAIGECNPSDTDPDVTALSGATMATNGGFIQQIVTDAFLARAFRADLALQNAGGVRVDFPARTLTIADAYILLPFSNTLVELELTGAEVVASLEEGAANFLNAGGSDGAYPYGSGIRWDVDITRPAGSRFTDVEVRDRDTGDWAAIDPDQTYIVVTNSFLAGGGDGYATFKQARDDGRVTDTFINYAQGFIDYVEQDLAGLPISVPDPEDFSTQSFSAP